MSVSLLEVVAKYYTDFAGLSYNAIASIILDNEPGIKLSHRSIRRTVSSAAELQYLDIQALPRYRMVFLYNTNRYVCFDRKSGNRVYIPADEMETIKAEIRANPTDLSYLLRRFLLSEENAEMIRNCLYFSPEEEVVKLASAGAPKILILDIETSPILGWVWKVWGEDVRKDRIESDWFCLSWAAKWLFETEIFGEVLTPEEVKNQTDSRIIQLMWELIDSADIVIAHNGKRFDMPRLNTRFIVNGLPPPSPYQIIDTKIVLSKNFGFSSASLGNVNEVLGIAEKLETSWKLWMECMKQNPKALEDMLTYNKQDVKALEELYLVLRPWIKSHPNIGLYIRDNVSVCPNCGSADIEFDGSFYYTSVNKYSVYRCKKCTYSGRSRISALSKQKRDSLLTTIAR